MKPRVFASLTVLVGVLSCAQPARTVPRQNQVTILYDAFGKPSKLTKDWGYSALIEYDGKRVLFDTGNNAELFRHNTETLSVDLKTLDCVVISHRHGDHTSGLSHVLSVNPQVTIYVPSETFGFGTPIPAGMMAAINRHDPALPDEMHYFGGTPQESRPSGSPWPAAHFKQITKTTEVAPGIILISEVSDSPGTREMHELSLAIRTSSGLVIVVGCSHPGIEKIVEAASQLNEPLYAIFGGFHLLATPDPEVAKITRSLHDKWKIERMAPGHCTGIAAFASLRELYGDKYLYAGLGTVIGLP